MKLQTYSFINIAPFVRCGSPLPKVDVLYPTASSKTVCFSSVILTNQPTNQPTSKSLPSDFPQSQSALIKQWYVHLVFYSLVSSTDKSICLHRQTPGPSWWLHLQIALPNMTRGLWCVHSVWCVCVGMVSKGWEIC